MGSNDLLWAENSPFNESSLANMSDITKSTERQLVKRFGHLLVAADCRAVSPHAGWPAGLSEPEHGILQRVECRQTKNWPANLFPRIRVGMVDQGGHRMSVIRVEKSDNFTILINDTLRDERLSLEATGLLVRLLSRPSDWMVCFEALRRENRVGRDKLRRILRELSSTGYLVRRRVRRHSRKFFWLTEVHEAPQTSDSKTVDGKQVDI